MSSTSMTIVAMRALVVIIVALLPPISSRPAAAADGVQTIRRFDTSAPVMVLTFDAGADRGHAARILDTLAAKGVLASFGMTGVWARDNPDLVQRMVREGHHLMNHTWDHPSFVDISSAARADQLRRTEEVVRAQTGVELRPYFRPPYGTYNDAVLADLAANGYTANILWTIDTLGWDGLSASQITQRVLGGAGAGVIVLMHVGAQSQDADALPGIIDQLRARGYGFATVRDFVSGGLGSAVYFPETGHWLSHGFLSYWRAFGGLPLFGYPISGELQEDGRTVQYFERARFEWHPRAWPARYDVLLGLLGVELTAGRAGEAPFRPVAAGSDPNCTFYPQTGHRLCSGFRAYWQRHGGLAIFGYPISEEFRERNPDTGQVYTVQYFERARFEWHPENAGTPWEVLLGRLGAQALAAR